MKWQVKEVEIVRKYGFTLCLGLVLVMALAACAASGAGGETPSPSPAPKGTTAPAAAPSKAPAATTAPPAAATRPMPAPGPSAGPVGSALSTLKLADIPYRLAMSPSGEWVAAVGFNAGVVLMRNNDGKLEVVQKTKDDLAPMSYNLAVADDGTTVIGTGRTLHVLRPDKAEPAWSFTFQADDPDKKGGSAWADISADGKTILLAAVWKGAAAFGFRADKNTPLWQMQFNNFSSAAISPDGKWALAGNTPETLLIDMEKGTVAKKYKLQANKKPSFSPDGGFFCADTAETLAVVAVGADQPTITNKVKNEPNTINVGNMISGGLSWGAQYAAVTRDRKTGLEFYRAGTAEPVWQVKEMYLAAIGADGRVVAVSGEGKVVGYDPTGKELWTYTGKGTGRDIQLDASTDLRFVVVSRGTTVELLPGY